MGQVGKIRYEYDLLERPISVQAPHWEATIPQNGFDAVGNLLERNISDNQGTLTYKYAYDNLYQLISENGLASHTYQNDSIYNRAAKDNQLYDVNALNQLLSQTNCSYHYDQNGNLIEKIADNHSTRYVYDALDRLIEVHDDKDITTYTYDSFHRRLSKTHNRLTTQFIYQNKKEIGAINQGKITQLRILGIAYGAEIGGAVILELDGKTYAPIHDSQGNVVALIDPSGKIIESYRYTAFGEIEIFSEKVLNNPWRFSSKRFDEETGFIFFGRRYYAPDIGRWTTADPAGYADGPNLCAYVHNQPLIYIDPDGLFSFPTVFADPNQIGNNAMSLLGNTRFQGAAQAAGGLAEVMIGVGITGLSEGLAAPVGFGIMAHGFDQTFTGLQTMFTGVHHKTATCQGLEITGMSPQIASLFDTSLSMAGSMGGIAALRAAEASSLNSFANSKMLSLRELQRNNNLNPHFSFPKNPNDLLPYALRDKKGYIYASDTIRIRPEQHLLKSGEIYNPRHHGLHYHVEIRKKVSVSWGNENNKYCLLPEYYEKGIGTGFLPGETFPGY